MYRAFYKLTRNPFDISPDPYFFYPTPSHNEALASLTYGVQRRKGFVVVTGEVGTGKTLLLRCLLDALNRSQIAFAFVYNPRLSVADFLTHVLTDLRLPVSRHSKTEMLSCLNSYLVARARVGSTAALIVDEAQLLSWELLEEIRLLTNLETSQHKLLQIVLVGQPELDRKLETPELRQLKQRIGLRCRLKPLSLDELRGYIHRRLGLAGANSHATVIFPNESIGVIHKLSLGIPRLVNTLCENSLISGYSKQAAQITPGIIKEVSDDLGVNRVMTSSAPDSDNAEIQKWILKALSRMIEELKGNSENQPEEVNLGTRVEAE